MVMQVYLNHYLFLVFGIKKAGEKMDTRFRMLCLKLRNMTSPQAADWLIDTYPISDSGYGEAIHLIPHRSWKRTDQIRLARYYFQKIPFANAKGYEVFASFMSFKIFVGIIRENYPSEESRKELLLYYLIPVLESAAKTDSDRELIKLLIIELK